MPLPSSSSKGESVTQSRFALRTLLLAVPVSLISGWIGGVCAVQFLGFRPPVQAVPGESAVNGFVTAEKLLLTDREGRARASFGISEDGKMILSMLDSEGKSTMTLGEFNTAMASLTLYSAQGRPAVRLGELENGDPGLALYDRFGASRLELSVDDAGSPLAVFRDSRGLVRYEERLSGEGDPSLRFYHPERKLGISLGLTEDGTKGLYFYGTYGVPRLGLVQSLEGDPVMGLFDRNRELIWSAPE